ncbi:MAG: LemA family protein [Candidatus Wallbacteria bacterium]|nr:LemA family protein [Candidatus Wallbacteria bacterium]
MKKAFVFLLILAVIVTVSILSLGGRYNSMLSAKVESESRWAEVDNQLKRRSDLIPNLVQTVRGFMEHEKEVLQGISDARTRYAGASGIETKIAASNELSGALSRLMMIVENYPQLKADQNFIRLQDELAGTENRLAVARQRYNESVKAFNLSISRFPDNMISGSFGFERLPFFEITSQERVAPKVEF